jgi:hypothetical protein
MSDATATALRNALIAGTVLQLAMVAAGHASPAVAQTFAVLGMTISFAAGWYYAAAARPATAGGAALNGAVAGGGCALIGIAASYALGDVPAMILAVGTLSSAVTGALGGLLGRALARRSTARA